MIEDVSITEKHLNIYCDAQLGEREMPEEILIKKYGNRRLYDTEKNTYIVLEQVAELIRDGRQVRVIDAKTKEDVTAFILTNILLEEARKKNFLLPIPLLHLVIKYGDTVLQEFFAKHLEQIIASYLNYKSTMDDQFKKWLEVSAQIADPAAIYKIAPFKSMMDLFSYGQGSPEKEAKGQSDGKKKEGRG